MFVGSIWPEMALKKNKEKGKSVAYVQQEGREKKKKKKTINK